MTLIAQSKSPITLHLVAPGALDALLPELPEAAADHLKAVAYTAKPGALALLPGAGGRLGSAVFTLGEGPGGVVQAGALPFLLPEGDYQLAADNGLIAPLAQAWRMGDYRFSRYKAADRAPARLVVKDAKIRARANLIGDAVTLGRDLINTPANDMTPTALAAAALALAEKHGAKANVVVGKELLKKNFPLIHMVGRASAEEPRLVDLAWGNPKHPKVTIIGKGVCFDTGGLDIKPSSAMALMKKDMGGAATALTLAALVMGAKLKVRLRVLVPIVENAISGNAFRTSDIVRSRKGLTVEIGNTDAEGRLILADTLALACEEKPDLLIDYATLTGAARVALGPDLPPAYTDDEALAAEIAAAGEMAGDPAWRLPLWPAYARMLDSKVADLSSTGSGGMAGSITAALFLKRFVEPGISWAHFDIYGWTPAARPGRPEGGEPQAARLTFALLEKRYG